MPNENSEKFLSRLKSVATRKAQVMREERQRQKLLGKKMTPAQASEFAARLHLMFDRRKEVLRGRKSELVPGASDTKELYRLQLPPGADAKVRRVRLSYWKYRNVVRKLAEVCDEDPDALLYELVQGTAFESARADAKEWAQQNTIISTLNEVLKRFDQQFGWEALFERTADLRLKYGARCTWPLSLDPNFGDEEHCLKTTEILTDPEQVYFVQNSRMPNGNRPALNAYFDAGLILGSEFFFVPHALIGHVCLWDVHQKHLDPQTHSVQRISQLRRRRSDPADLKLPDDKWDEAANEPKGQKLDLEHFDLEHPLWLVVYPDPATSKPVPALYQPIELAGDAFLAPLNRHTLAAMADGIWLDKHRDSTIAERLIELLTPDESDISPIERAWDRTGSWLQHNPVLKADRSDRDKLKSLHESAKKKRNSLAPSLPIQPSTDTK